MKLLTGKRIGQSGSELAAAVSFSLFFHAVAFLGALYLSFNLTARFVVPTVYRVKLVDLPADVPLTAPAEPAPGPQPKAALPKPAPAPKAKQATAHAAPRSAPAPKEAMPELPAAKKKPEKAVEAPAAPSTPAAGTAGKKQEAVGEVTSSTQEDNASPELREYLNRMKFKIQSNWRPQVGSRGLKAKVSFKVLRSGLVADVRLDEATGNFYFDQFAIRTILSSSPFPPLPEGFFKDYEVFSVDLIATD